MIDCQIPSDEVVFVGTHLQIEKAQALRGLLAANKIKVEYFEVKEKIKSETFGRALKEKLNSLNRLEGSLVFNASCGSRLAVLTASHVCSEFDIPVYVVEPTQDRISWVAPTLYDSVDVADKIQISQFLQAYQTEVFRYIDFKSVHSDRAFSIFKQWLEKANAYSNAFGRLNAITSKANSNHVTGKLPNHLGDTQRLISDLIRLGYAIENEKEQLVYTNETCRKMGMGMWLEYITLALVDDLREELPTIQDIGWGVEVMRHNDSLRNELDVCFLANNKLHVVECKTKKYQSGEVKSIIHQLEVLADLMGGYSARGALVSLKPVSSNDSLRAEELGIKIFGPNHLPNLKAHMKRWIEQA
ncbi:Card1-like endonuclease domain-containing protein [Thalassotalea litorea]|uniref:Card1-like endonuclease domain-containing protein n=1 Tax=Thalassotalea litorea TaxID=2020715 RepID=UPI003736C24C